MDRDALAVAPAGNIPSLRRDRQQIVNLPLPANQEVVLDTVQGNAIEIQAEIDTGSAPLVELNVLRSPRREEFTRIAFYRGRGFRNWERYTGWERSRLEAARDSLVTLDNSYSSILPDVQSRAPETGPVYLAPDENLQLRVFVDKSVVEVYVNGRQCLAVRVYPGRDDSLGVSVRAQGGDACLQSLSAWQMDNIYA